MDNLSGMKGVLVRRMKKSKRLSPRTFKSLEDAQTLKKSSKAEFKNDLHYTRITYQSDDHQKYT